MSAPMKKFFYFLDQVDMAGSCHFQLCEDVFDEDDDSLTIENAAWDRLQSRLNTEGYREGISHAKDENVKKGFTNGYLSTIGPAYKLAKLRGMIVAILGQIHNEKLEENKDCIETLEILHSRVIEAEDILSSEEHNRGHHPPDSRTETTESDPCTSKQCCQKSGLSTDSNTKSCQGEQCNNEECQTDRKHEHLISPDLLFSELRNELQDILLRSKKKSFLDIVLKMK